MPETVKTFLLYLVRSFGAFHATLGILQGPENLDGRTLSIHLRSKVRVIEDEINRILESV